MVKKCDWTSSVITRKMFMTGITNTWLLLSSSFILIPTVLTRKQKDTTSEYEEAWQEAGTAMHTQALTAWKANLNKDLIRSIELESIRLICRGDTDVVRSMASMTVQRSKVKVTRSITLHNNTSFPTTFAFFSHSLGGDTSTITLQPRFVVIRYSLGGDIDNSNTAWVRTLWVHSSLIRATCAA